MTHEKIVVKEYKKKYPKAQPYLSIDLETTALNPEEGTILEIAAIYDDLESPIEDLVFFHRVVEFDPNEEIKGTPYALQMNVDLLKESCGLKESTVQKDYLETVAREWFTFLSKLPGTKEGGKITVAGKNAAGFDLPWLKHHRFAHRCFKHRVIDPGSMYFKELGKVGSLPEIKEYIGLSNSVSHRAFDDALDVIKVIRHKLGVK